MHTSNFTTVEQSLYDEAKELVRNKANLDATDENGNTLLLRAAINDSWNVVRFLMAKGANVEIANNDGWTLLHSSAFFDNLEMLEILFGDKALYTPHAENNTLCITTESSNEVTQDSILDYIDNSTLPYFEHNNALKVAQTHSRNSTGIDSSLYSEEYEDYDYNAPSNITSEVSRPYLENSTEASYFADENSTETTNIPANYTTIDNFSFENSSQLSVAPSVNVLDPITRSNTCYAPDPNVADKYGFTPLLLAAERSSLEVVEYLVDKGADLNATAIVYFDPNPNLGDSVLDLVTDYYTPLNFAAGRRDGLNITMYLVQEKGVDIDVKSLNLAAEGGHLETLTYLIGERPDLINATDNYGDTPSHAAVYGGLHVVQYLKKNGADIDAKNNRGQTPLEVALELNKSDIIHFLKSLQHHRGKRHLQEKEYSLSFESKGASHSIESDNPVTKSNQAIDRVHSWINVVTRTIVDAIKGVIFSPIKPAIDTKYSQSSKATQYADMKGVSEQEALGYAVNIVKGFKKVVEQARLKSGVSMHRLKIDHMGMQKEITRKVMGGKFNEVSGIISSYVEKACPGREAGCPGRLNPKKFDKFMIEFNKGLDVTLNQSMQQILNNRNSTLGVDGVKEQQISLEPKGYLNNVSVQGHLTQAENLRLG